MGRSSVWRRRWISELFEKINIDPELVGEYSGACTEVQPITVATHQVVTWRDTTVPEDADVAVVHPHLALFDREPWGLVIDDEVHLLPAPVLRVTARIQAVRRLGLTATLIREDGREDDVFGLIVPERHDAPLPPHGDVPRQVPRSLRGARGTGLTRAGRGLMVTRRSPGPWRDRGEDPDDRFSLANERTFLAWIRTALVLVAGDWPPRSYCRNCASRSAARRSTSDWSGS